MDFIHGTKIRGAVSIIAICLLSCSIFLSSCRRAPETETDTLTFWVTMSGEEAEAVRLIGKKFTEESGIAVDVREIGIFEITTKLELAAPAGKGPDILSITHTSVGALALMKLITPIAMDIAPMDVDTTDISNISANITASLKDCPESLVSAFTWSGGEGKDAVLYGVPLTVESYGLVINRGIIKSVPDTMEELIETATNLTRDTDGDGKVDTYGFLTDPTNFYFTFPFYDANGAYIFAENAAGCYDTGNLGFCTEGGVSALTFMQGLTQSRCGAPALIPKGITYPIISDLFSKGKAAAMIHGTYLIPYYRSLGIDVGYYPIPPFSDGRRGCPLSTLMGIAVSAYSDKKEDALKFVAFFLRPENMRAYFEASGGVRVMVNPKIYTDEDYEREPTLETSVKIAGDSLPFPNDPAGELVWDAFADGASLTLEGKSTPKDALCTMEERLKTVISEIKK
ncbi:MAG: extracellular solute-binding protein [Deltaproteobacteria bacterium]|uniref:Extracellular solute-binding protein n=1 Tax=Candidatus Zymogenus saltonus TaxID=2844893 RepID=A0A9D8KD26_9DELT|nr:extracellular solute-binding protein [Candidatus Zymogenus saltonus]